MQPFKQAAKNKEAVCFGRKRIPEMKKLLWANQRKGTDFERQYGALLLRRLTSVLRI